MTSSNYIKKLAFYIPVILLGFGIVSCRPEKFDDDHGLSEELKPTFTVTPVQGRNNTFVVRNTTPGAISTRWDLDKGTGYVIGKMYDTVFYPDAGVYNIRLQAMGKGGTFYDAAPQTVNITTSDPVAGNLVVGGKMDAGDDAKWSRLNITSGVTFTLVNGKMVATGGNWGHAAIYQPIQVQANKKYKFGMVVSGAGATDVWFEVYFGTTAPVQGVDYTAGGNRIGLNTWGGCGNAAFNGNLATIGCSGSLVGKNGEVTFTQSGTVYLVIKTGGANLGTSGISIDNVELRGM
jgi:hypothetical protein